MPNSLSQRSVSEGVLQTVRSIDPNNNDFWLTIITIIIMISSGTVPLGIMLIRLTPILDDI